MSGRRPMAPWSVVILIGLMAWYAVGLLGVGVMVLMAPFGEPARTTGLSWPVLVVISAIGVASYVLAALVALRFRHGARRWWWVAAGVCAVWLAGIAAEPVLAGEAFRPWRLLEAVAAIGALLWPTTIRCAFAPTSAAAATRDADQADADAASAGSSAATASTIDSGAS